MPGENALPELEKHWHALARVLFGKEVGELGGFEPYLRKYLEPVDVRKSAISGKEVVYSKEDYCEDAKAIGFDEIDFRKKFSALSINDVKDIDSLFEAAGERAVYAGSIIRGNSKFVGKSTTVNDSYFVYGCSDIESSKYVAHSCVIRDSDTVFGCNTGGMGNYLLHCNGFINLTRCFEVWVGSASSDCFYSHNIDNCHECIFCFNLRSRRFCIGNLEIERSKFLALKGKLLLEIADRLQKEKSAPSLVELTVGCKDHSRQVGEALKGKIGKEAREKQDKGSVEEAFRRASGIIFGKPLVGMDRHGEWLLRHNKQMRRDISIISGREVLCGDYGARFFLPQNRFIADSEMEVFGENIRIGEEEAEGINLGGAAALLGKVAYFNPSILSGQNRNVIECASTIDANSCYRCVSVGQSEKCAYSFVPRQSQYLFGCNWVIRSSFCIKCYDSAKITRCFEVDNATSCSDSYFCHDVENVHNSMFCFNVKNLNYAIGNCEVGREKFLEVKSALQKWMLGKLEKEGGLEMDIFNVGCKK
ncbi:Uncharacterised protein [Candidatus Anstonella stagnisolia]|nr:Uncharacterised protein [Candidatus Anstonella stagnisolia]